MPANHLGNWPTAKYLRGCSNPRCDDTQAPHSIAGLCPSCQLIGRVAFALGAIIAGIVVKLLS